MYCIVFIVFIHFYSAQATVSEGLA